MLSTVDGQQAANFLRQWQAAPVTNRQFDQGYGRCIFARTQITHLKAAGAMEILYVDAVSHSRTRAIQSLSDFQAWHHENVHGV